MSPSVSGTYDVVIIGAGVQGLAAAYNLARGGCRRVLVLEREARPGMGSSARSGSMLMKSRENAPKVALSLYSYERYMTFSDEFGEPLQFRRTGFVSAVPPDLADRYLAMHRTRTDMGVPSEVVDPSALSKMSPALRVEDLAFGLYCPDDGEIDVAQIVGAFARHATALGVELATGETAVGLEVRGGRVTAVRTTRGVYPCAVVVNAAGADAAEVAAWAGLSLPIDNRRRSIFLGTCEDPRLQVGPMVEDAAVEWYFRGLGGRRVLVGMGKEPTGAPGDEPDWAMLPDVRRVAAHRAPTLERIEVVAGSSGIRSLTPDLLPILGPAEGVDGMILSCGWGGEGIMHAPAGGAVVADTVLGSRSYPYDRDEFMLSRFATQSTSGGYE
ncbi:MAG TPA: FAD-dependent oxidoreductase [Egibacteraceae bacterium]|nr:FAD-dependent oxidoreductase [Egibacteraceae bacterium]